MTQGQFRSQQKKRKISQGLNSYLDRCILGVSWAPQPFRLDYLLCPHFPILHVFFRKNFQWKRLWSIPAEKFVYSDQFKWKSVLSGRTQNKKTYWVCLSKGQDALKSKENKRGGERKEERKKGEKRSFRELTYKLNFLFDFERVEEHPVYHFLFL